MFAHIESTEGAEAAAAARAAPLANGSSSRGKRGPEGEPEDDDEEEDQLDEEEETAAAAVMAAPTGPRYKKPHVPWSAREDELLLEGVRLYDKNYMRISEMKGLEWRNRRDCRDRFKKLSAANN